MDEFLFPYKQVRPIQEALTKQVYSVIENKYNLITHAPTGLGKTAATLGPALKQAIDKKLTVFFLTPRHSQHHIAIETLKEIKEKYKLDFKIVDLIGKKHMCMVPGVDLLSSGEFSDYCKEVKKKDMCEFYNNLKNKVKKEVALKQIPDIAHVEEFCKISHEHKMCPFELSCEKAKEAKVIIADYFHILSPTIRKTLFQKTDKELERSIIIFDEAHNLPDKCRDLLSVNLSTITIDKAIRETSKYGFKFTSDLEAIKNQINKLKLPLDKNEILIEKTDFPTDKDLIEELKLAAEDVTKEQKRSSIGSIANFLEAWAGQEYGFIRILSRKYFRDKPFLNMSYKCLDPSFIFKEIKPYSMILMSGTLSPTEMYEDLLGMNQNNTVSTEYKSPFPHNNRLNLIVPTTSTKFTQRSEEMYQKIADTCAKVTNIIPGSVAIFFPSYKLRDEVNKHFQDICNKTIFYETPKSTKIQKQELIENFKKYKNQGAVILGAASGSLGEGIDLPDNLLKAVIVVGLPLGKPDLETQQLIEYYQDRYQRGWDYAYIYPAIIKALQNAGRCIRSETDKGVIVFLDERYTWPNYQKCFPPDIEIETVTSPEDKIKEFFS